MQPQGSDTGKNLSSEGFKSLYDSWERASTEHQEREQGVRVV